MDVVCPRCQSHHRVDPPGSGRTTRHPRVRCSTCGHTFPVLAEGVLAPPPPPERASVSWVRVDGEIFAVPDLATLQRWVLEKRVLPDDRGSADGSTWSAIGDRPELGLFFEAADRLDRTSASAQHALMTMAHSDAEDVFADPAPADGDGDGDGDVTVLPGGAEEVDEEPIPAGDYDEDDLEDDADASARTSTSLSFAPDHLELPAGFVQAGFEGEGGSQARSASGDPSRSGGTASVRIAPPALPEAVEDAPAAQAYAIAESERATGGLSVVEPAASADGAQETSPAPTTSAEGAQEKRLARPSGVRLKTPPGARRDGAPPPAKAAMPDFHPHLPGPHLAGPHLAQEADDVGPSPQAQNAPPVAQEPAGGFSLLTWFILLLLATAAIVTALWMHGPTPRDPHATGQTESAPRSPALPTEVRPSQPAPSPAVPGIPAPPPTAPLTVPSMAAGAPTPASPAVPSPAVPSPAVPNSAVPAPAPTMAPGTPAPTAERASTRPTGRAAAKAGWDAVERERWSVARAAFEQVLVAEPGNPWAAYGRAYVAERTGDLATAKTAYCVATKHAGTGDLARDIQAGARRVSANCPP